MVLDGRKPEGKFLLGLALISSLFVVGQTTRNTLGQIRVSVSIAKQNNPIEVLGFKRPQSVAEDPQVHLRNISPKEVVHIWIEVLSRGPSGIYGIGFGGSGGDQARSAERGIPPGGEVWVHERELHSWGAIFIPSKPIPACLDIRPLILRVEFANGAAWDMDPRDRENVLATPFPKDQASCIDLGIRPEEWARFKSVGAEYNRKSGKWEPPDAGEVDSYSYTCTLERFNSDLGLRCPF